MEYKIGDTVELHVYDHFSQASDTVPYSNRCISVFSGTVMEIDDLYVVLRHIKADISNPNSAEETHHVFKAAIIKEDE